MPAGLAQSLSLAIQRRVLGSEAYRQASAVALYADKDNEVMTDAIMTDALASGRQVLFPKVMAGDPPRLSLIAVRCSDDLAPGAFGVREPSKEREVGPATMGRVLMCVPGLGFSPEGARLGQGGGFYDRLIDELSRQDESAFLCAGLAYSFQMLERLPEGEGDRRMDLVFTESSTFGAPRRRMSVKDDGIKEVSPGGRVDWNPGPPGRSSGGFASDHGAAAKRRGRT